jgi:DNA-binding NarL/FixJ family response regulator
MRHKDKVTVILANSHRLVAEGLEKLLETDFEILATVDSIDSMTSGVLTLSPKVLITDVSLSGEDAIAAFADLKAQGCETRGVFVTFNADPFLARRALNAGAMGYVLQNSGGAELRAAVNAAAEGRSFICGLGGFVFDRVMSPPFADNQAPGQSVTSRQREVLRHLARGLSARDAGLALGISHRTVEYHKYQMMQLAGVSSGTALVLWAMKNGLIESDEMTPTKTDAN